MEIKWKSLPIQIKMSISYIIANVLVLIVNLLLLSSIHLMTSRMDQVYQKNLNLHDLTQALTDVQNSMTDYLSVKSSDALEAYYRSEQIYNTMLQELGDKITDVGFDRMERNIKHMSKQYLDIVEQAIEAKRGRNVEKYRTRYENATELYNYLHVYIDGLNTERFKHNSEKYGSLLRSFGFFEVICIVVMFVVMIANVLSIIKMTQNIIRPLKDLASQANEVARGNFDIEELPIQGEDEIGVVTIAFNGMVENIKRYIERIKKSMEVERTLKEKELMMETHLKDAQLKYLQAQINPHFLFNSLNAGAQLAMMEEADRTYEYVQNMADFFRYNVKKGFDTVTVKDELELVDSYVYIINVRFAGDVHYEKQIDKELMNVPMPSMILQPLVENCINHGIREMEGKGKIFLSVYKKGNTACISIKDNGKGMQSETIQKVLDGTYRESVGADSNGIGMDNVIARLKLFTGMDDVVTILSEGEGKGTEVLLYLQMNEGEDKNV